MSNKIDITLNDKELEWVSGYIREYGLKEDLITNNIKRIYKKDFGPNYHNVIPRISKLLYSIGIDPLDYMDEVPEDFILGCDEIQSFTIPNHIKRIGSDAFLGCNGLTSIAIPDSVIGIDSGAFYGCDNLMSVTIGNNVTYIDVYAFYKCGNLNSVTIPNSVIKIYYDAFVGCRRLKSINYLGTMSDWNKINIDSKAFSRVLKEIKCKDGIISLGQN